MAEVETIRCIFCGQDKAGSKEHVIPKWIRKRLGITSDVTTSVPSGDVHTTACLNVLLRRHVCVDYNGGWMKALEDKVAPFLRLMLLNESAVDLDAEQQRDLARWIVMKVLLLELSIRQQYPGRRENEGYVPSEAELAWLFSRDDPPPRSRVWLGAFDAKNRIITRIQARLFELRIGPLLAPPQ